MRESIIQVVDTRFRGYDVRKIYAQLRKVS
jgi:hypothetical protein